MTTPPDESEVLESTWLPLALPETALAVLRDQFDASAHESRYFAQALDLDGDGDQEIVVHVAGPMVCGTGGCDTLVLTPEGEGYRLVADVGLTRPPIRAATSRTHGWRDLVVEVAGGGGPAGATLVRFDGSTYPDNPSVEPAELLPAPPADAEIVIEPFDSFTEGAPLFTDS
jgi:hypothetical protein